MSGKPRKTRRLIANLLIIGGLLVLLYPAGTWVYERFQQRALAGQLEQEHPQLKGEPLEYFQREMVEASREHEALVQTGLEAERKAKLEALRASADAFRQSLSGSGGEAIGRILIPAIGVDVVLIEGTGRSDLREGPGHWPETPFPGQQGNFVISGHRTTYGGPFFKLNNLKEGDEIRVLLPYAAVRYKVQSVFITMPDRVDTVRQRGVEEISLATCHPIYSAKQRLVVKAELEAFTLIERDTAATSSISATGSSLGTGSN